MKKYILISSGIFFSTLVVLFAGYIFVFQQVINQMGELQDEHCINVNPLIIDRKEKYITFVNDVMASVSGEEFKKSILDYRYAARKYMSVEKLWLIKDRRLLDSFALNLLMPSFAKDSGEFQYSAYDADYLSSFYLDRVYDEKNQVKQIELTNKVIEESNIANDSYDNYDAIFNSRDGKTYWIARFISFPVSKCPAANQNIPDTQNIFIPTDKPSTPNSNIFIPSLI